MENMTDIIWLEEAESSNDVARMTIDDLDNLSVVSVRHQTKGRGQHGRTWESGQGENLTFSLVLKNLEIAPRSQIAISQITSLSLVELLKRHGIEAKIKWPNDIYVGKNKICGILIENSITSEKIKWSIIGIGLNVNQTDFPEWIPNPTSMTVEKKIKFNQQNLLVEFTLIFTEYHNNYLGIGGDLSILNQMYLAKDWNNTISSALQQQQDPQL